MRIAKIKPAKKIKRHYRHYGGFDGAGLQFLLNRELQGHDGILVGCRIKSLCSLGLPTPPAWRVGHFKDVHHGLQFPQPR